VLWDRLMTARAKAARRSPAPRFRLASLQAGLAPDEAVISYYWLARGTLLIVTIDAGSVIGERVNLTDAQRADLDSLISDIGDIGWEEQPWLDDDVPGLGELLLPREGRKLLTGKDRLIVSPHRVLHQLPFHAFGFEGAPLAEHFAVSYVPNLTSLLIPAPGPRSPQVFVLGVSTFDPPIPSIANAGPEAATIAGLYRDVGVPTTALLEGQATVAAIDELNEHGTLAEFTTLHLATHGDDVPPSAPFDAALYLSSAKIDGLDVSQWRLNADLVVLSACDSARRAISGRHVAAGGALASSGDGEELFGDEVLGLQAAFFAAGARQVLGALWPASELSAPALMTSFHQGLNDGLTADRALSKAMNDVRGKAISGLPDGTDSMFHWAPYKLVRLGSVTPPAGRRGHAT
jgi:CHAT domain-containing protein